MGTDYKLIPYGISNFKQVRSENKYLVDKTMYFEKMEQAGNFLFLVRPRRFGKSLFLNMLEAYYDVNEKYGFEDLFSGLYVADHPTENRNKYQVMHLDFSLVGSDVERLQENFDFYLSMRCDSFARRYARFYPDGFVEEVRRLQHGEQKLNYINVAAHTAGCPLYLVVDEYDNFTNNVLNIKGHDAYHALTHGTGFYRDVFKLFKPMFDRIIMLGVSPITLDDLTSGYNIALNITMDPRFNQMLGFSEDDVRQMIRYYKDAGAIKEDVTEDSIIDDIKPWYDNYCFAEESFGKEPSMFNSDMVCYYMNNLIGLGSRPKELVDPNTMTDYGKLKRLIEIDTLEGERLNVVHDIAEQGYVYGQIVSHFPAERMMEFGNFLSLLYYYGMLTIGGVEGELLKLTIPNNNVRLQYYHYLLDEYQSISCVNTTELSLYFSRAALHGDWQPLIKYICRAYHDTTAIRQLIEGERNLQGFMNAYLTLTNYYLIAPEMEFSHGYCDFFLLPNYTVYPMVKHSYILELKYLKADATDADAKRQWSEAVEQITSYAADKKLQSMLHGTQLHPIVVQIKGYDAIRIEEVGGGK
ncbi:ATP-binding protein [Prevotella lacticifex]|uniref:ATPase AAA n=1 Tax=Prevotella lacticifex TaxID=2854755 RepID=A0A9R1CZ28_9BACT|nr:ATP-binding protein [Prevotella lacticifex]GJG36767.1 ATPase AAA [Prevotella lacticifex]GJG38626.1 ATPase AAA [Prevotella lacticifex]GJG42691.1 ATPase AAA [Prevotella lacticifex]GJG44983.1 ATPase AAA [Prevotella lacticifex]GJG49043.1 ATPase AAA [Prevotella lacticifex]